MIYCPCCYNQGAINKATVKGTNLEIYICDECDLVWVNLDINETNWETLTNFMNKLGLKALWSELENAEML